MAVVGEASVIVRAVTTGVKNEIQRAFNGADRIAESAGSDAGAGFSRGFKKNNNVAALFGKSLTQRDIDVFAQARQRFLSLARTGYTLAASITALGGVVGGLVGGLGVLVTIAAAATPALLALSGSFLAVAASAAVLKATFGGVGEAISAGAKTGKGAAVDAEALRAANERLNDAYYNLNETLKENTKRKEEGVKAVADATQSQADAAISVERAERTYRDAINNTQKALEDVTKAREEAKEAIQQLRFELEGGVISEKKARLEFEKARDSLQRVQDLPPNSRARREAELAFASADLNLRRAIDKNNDLRKTTAKANREGVEGSEKVVDAQAKLVSAKEAENDANIDAARAVITLKEATEELNKARKFAEVGGQLDIENARRAELAYREVADAKRAITAVKNPGLNDFTAALDKLSPAAQDFVKYILSLKEAFEELRKKLQEAFFPKFTEAVKLLYDTYFAKGAPANLEEALISLAAKLGEISKLFADAFSVPSKALEVKAIFESFTPIIDALGKAFIALTSSFVALTAAFIPFTIEFALFVQKKAEALEKAIALKAATGELNTIFTTATDIVKKLGEAFGNAFSAFGTILTAIVAPGGAADIFLQWFIKVTKSWEDTTKALNAEGALAPFFATLTTNFTKILEIIGLVILGLVKISATEGFGLFLDDLKLAVIEFNKLGESISNNALPALGNFILAFSKFTVLVADSGAIAVFFNTLAGILNGLVLLLDNEIGRAFLAVTGTILAFSAALGLANIAFAFYVKSLKSGILSSLAFGASAATAAGKVSLLGPAAATAGARIAGLSSIVAAGGAPLIALAAAVVGAVVVFKLAYDSSENLRTAVSALTNGIKVAFSGALKDISDTLKKVFPVFNETGNVFKSIGDVLSVTLIPILGRIAGILIGTVSGAFQRIIYFIGAAKEALMIFVNFLQFFFKLFTGDFRGAIDEIKQMFINVVNIIKNLLKGIAAPFIGALNGIIDVYNGMQSKFSFTVPDWIPKALGGGKTFSLPGPIKRINFANLAEGGVVYPTLGGTIARIGEAGSAERIEPLDSSGLSKRDRAMIQMLAGPAGGINITVNPSAGMDERELAALVSRQLAFQLRKGAA